VTSLLPFRTHIVELLVLVAAGVGHSRVVKSTKQRRYAIFSLLALAVVIAWPLGDLAASVSVTVATVQRLVIMLFVAPLALLSLSTMALAQLTRPTPIDVLVRWVAHPGVAIALVTIVGTFTLSSPAINWGARSSLGRDVVLLFVVAIGVVLWIPALGVVPGTRHLSPTGQAGYLFASSLVVTSLSFVWIFARHSLYSGLHHQYALLHMTPLLDQQIAGFVAKFGAYVPMWATAFTIFSRAEEHGVAVEETPLYWADVERALLRADRKEARKNRRGRRE
jgi:cytochrome c oxidase assembly factor CtaG